MKRQHPTESSVKKVIYHAILALTGGDTTVIFTNREVMDLISRQNPDFKVSNVGCELRADCVNNPERDYQYPNRTNYDYYWRVARGQYRLYNPETDHPERSTFTAKEIKDVAVTCWWKFTSKKKLAEQFNLTEERVDALRETAAYKKCVFDLMLGQRISLEEFDKWVDDHHRKYGDMGRFAHWMGLDLKEIPAMVEDVRKAHADIDAGRAETPDPIPDPYRRPQNYRYTLYWKQERKCNGCKEIFVFRDMTLDHILPRSRGGTDDPKNLQLLCKPCNSSKGARTPEEWCQVLKEKGQSKSRIGVNLAKIVIKTPNLPEKSEKK